MKAVLPRVAKGVHLPEVFEITMNEFDVERLLPSLFYLAVTKGRPRGARVNDPTAMEEYLSSLASHPSLGFDAPGGQRLPSGGGSARASSTWASWAGLAKITASSSSSPAPY